MKKLLSLFLCLGLVGCIHAGLRSDFGAFTSINYPPKSEQEEVLLMTEIPQRPYKEIGIITVDGRRRTPLNAMNQEILRVARENGADAVIKLQYSGGERMSGIVDGEVMSMTSRKQATGVAIVYTNKK